MPDAEKARVLYIEDDPITARVVQTKLRKVGYRIELAATGEEGLRRQAPRRGGA